MKILLLFGLFPKEAKGDIIKNSKGVVQYAADALQWSFVDGLSSYYNDISLINLPYVGSFPKYYKKVSIKKYDFSIYENINFPIAKNIGFNNIHGIKMFSRYFNSNTAIKKWISKYDGDKIVIVYALHLPFIEAVVNNKKLNSELKICLIIPDLPEYMNEGNGLRSIFISLLKKRLGHLYKYIDYFVFLTEHMKNIMPIEVKKYTVIEGIYNKNENIDIKKSESIKTKTVFYGGTLAPRYGVLNLVHAFTLLKNKNYRLIICGEGPASKEIRSMSENDPRIVFKGQIPRDEVLQIILESDLLVNPRTPEGDFTKYSFPSKTMEYLGSGIPTLLYRLEGIPDEYFNYCFSLDDYSIENLSKEINRILSLPKTVLDEIGENAKNFILRNKNPVLQCEKLIRLINNEI